MLFKSFKCCFTGHKRIATIKIDHEKCAEAGCENRPEECHAIFCPRLSHGGHAPGAEIEAKQKNTWEEQGKRTGKLLTKTER